MTTTTTRTPMPEDSQRTDRTTAYARAVVEDLVAPSDVSGVQREACVKHLRRIRRFGTSRSGKHPWFDAAQAERTMEGVELLSGTPLSAAQAFALGFLLGWPTPGDDVHDDGGDDDGDGDGEPVPAPKAA
jgi:hypothetical protein